MRVEKCSGDAEHVAELRHHTDWLLQLGDDKLTHVQPDSDDIQLPSELCLSTVEQLVDSSCIVGTLAPTINHSLIGN